ncbi:MAG: molybdopterin synthase small subunit [Pseudomonadota bacterium]|jgi:molybdopterin synthase sulfur carrier subunit
MQNQLEIRLFASLRERLGLQRFAIDWIEGDVSALRAALVSRGDDWADFAHPGRVRVAVNQVMASESTQIQAGDEVACFPPVTGG